MIFLDDEVDSASNNQVFLDFLAQMRGYYLDRHDTPTFHSVILAGVHDIRNLRQKIRPDAEHKHNSPWNIASPFDVDMSFSPDDIAGMLTDYENEHHTGIDIQKISQLIYDYTSGYPVLVSSICKLMDEHYIETQTRDQRRTDVIVDYLGKQYVIELKIWHGDEYNTQGEKQLSEYLDYYYIEKGYLLSFNFNKNKQSGMHTIELNGRMIVEAIV